MLCFLCLLLLFLLVVGSVVFLLLFCCCWLLQLSFSIYLLLHADVSMLIFIFWSQQLGVEMGWKTAFFLLDLSHGKEQICIGNAKNKNLRTYGTPKINYLVPYVLQNAKKMLWGGDLLFPAAKMFFAHFLKTLVLRV